jgi:glutaredoxin
MKAIVWWQGCLLAVALLGAGAAQADKLYKWVDPQGRVSYHDQPPPSADIRVEEKNIRTGRGETTETGARPEVVLYAAPKCASCDLARNYLMKRNVSFQEKNAESDPKIQQELREKSGGLAVPTIIVGTKVMRGYMESLLDDELTAAGYAKAGEGEKQEGKSAGP